MLVHWSSITPPTAILRTLAPGCRFMYIEPMRRNLIRSAKCTCNLVTYYYSNVCYNLCLPAYLQSPINTRSYLLIY